MAATRHDAARRPRAILLLVTAGAAAVLGACASTADAHTAGLDAGFGEAVRHNIAAQAVAPTEQQKANRYIPPNTQRQRLAVETYEAGEVELEPIVVD